MTPADHPLVPSPAGGAAEVYAEFSRRHVSYLPAPSEELSKRLEVPPEADEAAWREAYAQRRALYAQRAGPDQAKPVRSKNLALLKQLEELQPALETHLQAYHVWRLLGEASDYLQARQVGRCRNRLKEAAALLEQQPPGKLRQWYDDLEADVADEAANAAPATKSEAPAVAPVRPPPMVVAPAETTAIEGGVVACAVAVWPKEASIEVGGLPAGLKFDVARGQIVGIPASAGDFTITVTASDASGQASARILLRVAPRELRPPRLVHSPIDRSPRGRRLRLDAGSGEWSGEILVRRPAAGAGRRSGFREDPGRAAEGRHGVDHCGGDESGWSCAQPAPHRDRPGSRGRLLLPP